MTSADAKAITASMADNETWRECPHCHIATREATDTPGLLHRYAICETCAMTVDSQTCSLQSSESQTSTLKTP